MKKFVMLAFIGFGFIFTAKAQEISKNAIGLRMGGSDGVGAEVSYQRQIHKENNRIEANLGWRNNSSFDVFKLTGLYHWVWNIENNFNWYAGAGAGFGNVEDKHDYHNDGSFLYLAGTIGIEYNFDIPLQISLDLRPEFSFSDYHAINDVTPDLALGVRYKF